MPLRDHQEQAKSQAHTAVALAVANGRLPRARDVACVRCGSRAAEYHHYLGYAPEHRLDVEALCLPCHVRCHVRGRPRGARVTVRRLLRLSRELDDGIKEVAAAESRSVNAEIEVAIREHVETWRRRQREGRDEGPRG